MSFSRVDSRTATSGRRVPVLAFVLIGALWTCSSQPATEKPEASSARNSEGLPAESQPDTGVKVLDETPSCEECAIRFEVQATLGSLSDQASPGPIAEAARLNDGAVAVSSGAMGSTVFLYGTDGKLLRSISGEGEGPGELMSAPLLRVEGEDELVLLDARQGRISRFTADGQFLEATPLSLRAMSFETVDDRYVVSGPRRDGEVFETIHVIDRAGEHIRSFGSVAADGESQSSAHELVRKLSVAPDGTLWAAAVSGGRLEQWDMDGRLIRAYMIANEDLQREAPLRLDPSEQTPPAQVSDIAFDGEGRLWIYIAVPDADFATGESQERTPEAIFDTRVLVFDPEREGIVAVDQFDTLLRPLAEGWGYDLLDTEIGDRRVRTGHLVREGF